MGWYSVDIIRVTSLRRFPDLPQIDISLQLMPRLLHRILIPLRPLAVLNPLLNPRPLLPRRRQLHLHDENRREVHHDIRSGRLVPEQELAAALAQLRLEVIEVLADVLGDALGRLLDVAGLLKPSHV